MGEKKRDMHERAALNYLDEVAEGTDAAWSKMDELEWRRWSFIMAFRITAAVVYAILALKED